MGWYSSKSLNEKEHVIRTNNAVRDYKGGPAMKANVQNSNPFAKLSYRKIILLIFQMSILVL